MNRQSSSSGIRSRPNKKCLPRLLTPIMGGKNWAACPSLAPVTPTLVRKATYSLGVQVVVVVWVWKPGDSLSPPDISPVRPLIRQQQGRAHLTCGVVQCLGGGGHGPLVSLSRPTRSSQFSAPRPLLRSRRARDRDRAPPPRAAPELGFVYSRREYILQLS